MDDQDLFTIRGLAKCSFLPGSFAKKFTKGMVSLADESPDYMLSDRQWYYLITLYHSYRTQIPDHDRNCRVCKALAANTPLIDLVCPGCGTAVPLILKPRFKSAGDVSSCANCAKFTWDHFALRRRV